MVNDGDRRSLTKLQLCVAEFRRIDRQIPPQQMEALLLIALRPGISLLELGKAIDVARASSSRITDMLATGLNKGREGYKVITKYEDEQDSRIIRCRLTPKGQRVIDTLVSIVGS